VTTVQDESSDFESSAWSGKHLEVDAFRWNEAIDATYRAELEIVIDGEDEDPMEMLGKDGVLTVRARGAERRLTGIATEVEHVQSEDPGKTHARVVLEPALALLELGQRSRIFQDKTASEIIDAVLREGLSTYRRSHRLSLDGTYPRREYCVQYHESDLAFVERLAGEEGIHYTFEHDGQTEELVLRDRNQGFSANTESTIRFSDLDTISPTERWIHDVHRASKPTTTKVAVADHDFTSPSAPKMGEKGDADREVYEFGLGRSLTLSDYAGDAYGAHDADRQAATRLEALAREAVVLEGKSTVCAMAEGTTFSFEDHSEELDGEYLLLAVEHRLTAPLKTAKNPATASLAAVIGAVADSLSDGKYENSFRAIPKSVVYRPLRKRPKPRVASMQTAVVTGPAGEEIHTDSHGRVKVQLHWDLDAPGNDTSSCWLRVKQAWAGSSWGFQFIPRVGMEVTVHFVHGDPDRPLVGGCLYNSDHAVPYGLPANKTKSTIKSQSTPGGEGFNELRFEDEKGKEQIYLHAQSSLDEAVLADHSTDVGGDQENTVHGSQTQTIDANQRERVVGNQKMTVDGNRTVTVSGPFKETILGGETRHVVGAVKESILSGGEDRTVVGPLTETLQSTERRFVTGSQLETLQASHSLSIGGSHSEFISGKLNQEADSTYDVGSTASPLMLKAGAQFTMMSNGTGMLTGTVMTIKCDTRTEIDPITLKISTKDYTFGVTKAQSGTISAEMGGLTMEFIGIKEEEFKFVMEGFMFKAFVTGFRLDAAIVKVRRRGPTHIIAYMVLFK
jgi:type VI secretion system secreted protein VgrG